MHPLEVEIELIDGNSHQKTKAISCDLSSEVLLLVVKPVVEFAQNISHEMPAP